MLSRHLAAEMGSRGIRVNCLARATVLNDQMAHVMTDEQMARLALTFPLGHIGKPDDVAAAATFLLSDQASWITGVTLDAASGRTGV